MTAPGTARILHAQLHLLDRQVVRADDGRLVCKVDDLEMALDEHDRPYVTAILAGPLALGPRIGGVLGRLIVATTELFRPEEDPAPQRIAMALVSDIGSAIKVSGNPEEPALERWVRRNLIAPLPGSGDPGTVPEPPRIHAEQDTGRTRLSRLIGREVRDRSGEPVGQVADAQLSQDGPLLEQVQHAFRLSGLIVVPRHTGQLFGYERGPGGQAPLLVRSIIHRLHRDSRYVRWSQIESLTPSEEDIRLSVAGSDLAPLTDLYQPDPDGKNP
jgi:sporulation protein YlmC with PRC-barrel domain